MGKVANLCEQITAKHRFDHYPRKEVNSLTVAMTTDHFRLTVRSLSSGAELGNPRFNFLISERILRAPKTTILINPISKLSPTILYGKLF